MKKILFAFLFSSIFYLPSSILPLNAAESSAVIRGIRPLGMGGAFVGLSDDHNAIFYNPAGLTQRRGGQATIFELPIGISDDIFNAYNFYNSNQEKLKDFDTLSATDKANLVNDINNSITKYNPRIRLGFPNAGYLSGPGFLSWGFGLFSSADIGFKIKESMLIPNVSFWGTVDGIFAIPLAHRFDTLPFIPGKMSAGATFKYITRARIAEYNKSILEFEQLDPLVQMGQGMGLDLGALYQLNDSWNIGLQIADFGGTPIAFQRIKSTKTDDVREATVGVIYPQWNVGTAYIPSKIYYWPGKTINTLNRLTLALDVRDIMNTDETLFDDTVWKKLHMGAEFRWALFSLRGGYNSGYPSFGVGVNLYLLTIDYAYWGDELGRFAGQLPEWNHQVTLAMRFGTNKGRAWGKSSAPAMAKTEAPVTVAEPTPSPAEPVKAIEAPLVSGTTNQTPVQVK